MRMTRALSICVLSLLGVSCGEGDRKPGPDVDCSVADAYEFENISDFASGDSGWFLYADNTPGAVPDPAAGSNVLISQVPAPGRCGDTGMVELKAQGHNVYGSGFGDWAHNAEISRANGSGFEGISFWARSPGASEKTFMLYADDGRTIVLPPTPTTVGVLPEATSADQDLDGDGFIGPGDIARGTNCRLPPDQKLGNAACYYGGELPPATPTRVPESNECGNQFHTYVTTTADWQLFLIPWQQLVQWPCPNRLADGIDPADVRKLEIKFLQGTSYDTWLDNIAFYRRRADGG
jgi:hypothetical protein